MNMIMISIFFLFLYDTVFVKFQYWRERDSLKSFFLTFQICALTVSVSHDGTVTSVAKPLVYVFS